MYNILTYICLNLFCTVLEHLKRINKLNGHKTVYNDNLRKLPKENGGVSVMSCSIIRGLHVSTDSVLSV